MWKPLSGISAVLLLGSGVLMYFSVRPQFLGELNQAKAAKENRELALKNQSDSKKARAQSDTDLSDAKNLLAKNTQLKNQAQAAKDAKVKEVTDATSEKDAAAKKLAEIEEKLKGLGGLEQLIADFKVLQAKEQALNTSIANTKDATAAAVAHKDATDKVIAGLKLKELYQKTGTVVANFRTTVTEVSPELGFVVLRDGNASNVTKGSKFDIRRGDSFVGRIVVTHLEQNRSIAEVVQGTMQPGMAVLPGDMAVVSASSTPRSVATPASSGTKRAEKKPAADAAPADPFAAPGGGDATAAPEKPADAAPAEKPEEMSSGN